MKAEKTKYPGIYRRGDRYVATVSYRDELGRARVKWKTCATLNEARRYRSKGEVDLEHGVKPSDARVALETFLADTWLPHVRKHRRPKTAETYEGIVRRYIAPDLGHVALRDLDRRTLAAFYDRQQTDSIRASCHRVLSSALGYASSDLGLIAANPCRTVKTPAVRRPEARHLDVDEARRLLKCAEGWRLEGAAVLGLVGGMRIAEVCSVAWRDVDFGTGVVTVRGSYWGRTKSGEPRAFTLPADAVARLRRYKRAQAEQLLGRGVRQTDGTHIVTKRDGTPMSPSTLWFAFDNFRTQHGFDVSFHGLRHSATMLMLSAGVDVKTAAARLGHNPSVLLRTYAHYVPSADAAAAAKMDVLLAADPAL